MKIALISDTHVGVRSDALAFLEAFKKFMQDQFFPYLRIHNISTIIHLGDLVDRRKYVNYNSLSYLRKYFVDPILKDGYRFNLIIGNHDIYFRETMEVSCASELFDDIVYSNVYSNFHYHIEPHTEIYDGLPILFVPWICEGNRKRTYEEIRRTNVPVVMGHLEFQGFEMYRGHVSPQGYSPDIFNKFEAVYSGHYHHPSIKGNIHYLGAAGEYNWLDYGGPRGFHIFDTQTRELEFVPNEIKMFHKVFYDDSKTGNSPLPPEGFVAVKDKIVKVIVSSRKSPSQFDWFMRQIEKAGPLEIQIVEDHLNLQLHDDENIVSEVEDVLTIIRNMAKQAADKVNGEKLDTLFVDLYKEANCLEKME